MTSSSRKQSSNDNTTTTTTTLTNRDLSSSCFKNLTSCFNSKNSVDIDMKRSNALKKLKDDEISELVDKDSPHRDLSKLSSFEKNSPKRSEIGDFL